MSPAAQWTSPQLERIADFIREYAGLVFPLNRQASAESGIRRAMARLGVTDARLYLELLARGGLPLDYLLAELTIGETYFFREPGQFKFLRNEVIPWFTKHRAATHGIRAWSAACASGEEAYSLAILLGELRPGASDIVLGTDISRARLSSAQRARYRRWSLRALPELDIERLFRQRGDIFELKATYRNITDFRYLNLAEDNYPAISTAVWGMDIIFCRNVLIYFDRETIQRVGGRLIDSLSTDGWLLLGASDPVLSDYVRCDVVQTESGLVYRKSTGMRRPSFSDVVQQGASLPSKGGAAASSSAWPLPQSSQSSPESPQSPLIPDEPEIATPDVSAIDHIVQPPESSLDAAIKRRDFAEVVILAQELQRAGDGSERVAVAHVRGLANLGRITEADHACVVALEQHRMSSELTYLHAILLIQAGMYRDATMAARRALYLDRSMVVAHMAMATACSRSGATEAATRALANAEALLEGLLPESIVPSSDGETAARLLAMARVQRSLLHRDVA